MAGGGARRTRHRDAFVAAMLPAPGRGLPAAGSLDLRGFWPRFEAVAPAHLRLGLRVALFLVAIASWLRYLRSFASLDDDRRDAVLVRAASLPGAGMLLDVAKVVVCFAYFADAGVEATVRKRT